MKHTLKLGLLAAILLLAVVFTFTSCTMGDGPGKKPPLTGQDSIADVAAHTTARYAVKEQYGDSSEVIAAVIIFGDSVGEEPLTGAKQVIMKAAYYTCSCGAHGVILPPYTIDTLKQ